MNDLPRTICKYTPAISILSPQPLKDQSLARPLTMRVSYFVAEVRTIAFSNDSRAVTRTLSPRRHFDKISLSAGACFHQSSFIKQNIKEENFNCNLFQMETNSKKEIN